MDVAVKVGEAYRVRPGSPRRVWKPSKIKMPRHMNEILMKS